jgi:hypothetical protein
MSERRLIAYVHVGGVAYGPGDEVPADVAKRIGEHAWADDDSDQVVESEQDPGGGGQDDVEAPPRSGRGSGVEAWKAFAEQHDVEVDEDASRDDIVALLEERGVIEREE